MAVSLTRSSSSPSPGLPPQAPASAEPFVLLDDATAAPGEASSRLYTGFAREDVLPDAAAIGTLDTLLAEGWRHGWHGTLFAPYEFGGPLVGVAVHVDQALPFHDGALRLLWFRQMRRLDTREVGAWLAQARDPGGEPAGVMEVTADTPEPAFHAAIARIHQWIEAGDTYQVNFTQRLRFREFGDPLTLYAALRAAQPVPYAALARLPGEGWVLSLSPELFVRHDGEGRLLARPMKGTAPLTGDSARDAGAAAALAQDAKNRAENVMIVDLLRNDLGRIAVPGTVAVPDRFAVQPFGRVLQMTSTVTAIARAGTSLADLMRALFPCGSITGAPKRRTMQIIGELEPAPRGLYTGSIGWIDAPAAGQGNRWPGAFALSVAIRTLVLGTQGPDGLRPGEMGVGGGIVHDSDAAGEYAECGWKARFLTAHDPGFTLFETMRVEDGQCLRLDQHLARLAASAACFGFCFERASVFEAVRAAAVRLGAGTWRLRLALDKAGTIAVAHGPLAPLATVPVRVLLAPQALPVVNALHRHKTSVRAVYDAGWQAAERAGAFDSLFFNTRGELLEGGRSSVFVKVDGEWLTPPLAADILPGVMRAAVLAHGARYLGGPVREAIVTRAMLLRAEALALANSLRGVLPAVLLAEG
ncbi:bifunctional anthranilate synthase component I family protein/class IV aminotransferase [Cupriavidus basilensis]|uniref:Bifunctional anthranilate synthase component I family protein/class IV aminotransferase n=1 Tax=Cupriavidus basilensis TaxID=68895 RepID=A0ABT6B3Z5_9BURK|nr:bifunctional anthranilate synthase component I family protein/class IV aminotransferase [Cupriavidus basilensis]MDF3839599.1 bifunctional anthranilate synthase component I family protein/class IV aminotransferase [Cupriavidus basilensis]